MTGILHQVLDSGSDSLAECLQVFTHEDEILLIDAGVELLASAGTLQSLIGHNSSVKRILAIREDVMTRGLDKQARESDIELIPESEWVEHVLHHRHVLSWK